MKDPYDFRLRILDRIPEPVPTYTRVTLTLKKERRLPSELKHQLKRKRIPLLLLSILACLACFGLTAVSSRWHPTSLLWLVWPFVVAIGNIIYEIRR